MFDKWIGMMGNYEFRKVALDKFGWGMVSTAMVMDGRMPYETAVEHNLYGDMVIVEAYQTKEEAAIGHAKWVATMTADQLPDKLVDCNNSEVQQMVTLLAGEEHILYKRQEHAS
jgi:hypothetical protein